MDLFHDVGSILDHLNILFIGDEILAVNGKSLQGMTHDEAINEFRAIKYGPVILRVSRRDPDDPILKE